jgi:hypothetical protein
VIKMNGWYGEIDDPYYCGRCRRFPWLPRWWWATPATPYAPPAPAPVPGYAPPVYAPPALTEEQELAMLESQAAMLGPQLEQIKKRLEELKK